MDFLTFNKNKVENRMLWGDENVQSEHSFFCTERHKMALSRIKHWSFFGVIHTLITIICAIPFKLWMPFFTEVVFH